MGTGNKTHYNNAKMADQDHHIVESSQQHIENRPNRSSVRRRLFEDGNPQEDAELYQNLDNLINSDTQRTRENATAKWNFDFENELPLEGEWEWENVQMPQMKDQRDVTAEREESTANENRNI